MNQPLPDLSGLLNLPDLLLALFLIWSVISGARRGFLGAVFGLVGRIAVIAGACWLAGTFAPALSRAVVTPIVGEVFAARAAQDALGDVLARLQMTVTEAAAAMAEGVAFLILAVFFLLILSIVLSLILHSLHLLTRFPPLGWLNRLAGAALGLVGGVAVVLLLLWCAHLVYPDLFSELGWLSQARIQSTVLLRGLLAYFPI